MCNNERCVKIIFLCHCKFAPPEPGLCECLAQSDFLRGDTNYIITSDRFPGYSSGPSIDYFFCPEAEDGGNIALVLDGDMIEIDIDRCLLELKVSEEELEKRRKELVVTRRKYPRGYLDTYARLVSSADKGGVIVVD